jgi:hypothetical protein
LQKEEKRYRLGVEFTHFHSNGQERVAQYLGDLERRAFAG